MKVYICGNKKNRKQFKNAEKRLREQGHVPVNPIKIMHSLPEEINNSDFTIISFELIRICDAVCPLEGWEKDLLARVEMAHAKREGKDMGLSLVLNISEMV